MNKAVYPYQPPAHVVQSPLFQAALRICQTLASHGHCAFFVGGSVRDFFLEGAKVPADIDVSTSASPSEILSLFPGSGFVGKAFGVALVQQEGYSFEVSTFRREGQYTDRRHPDFVEPGTMEEDSRRRDFTVNALYYDPVQGTVTDFHRGWEDVHGRCLRCVGRARDRLYEDPLRVLRLFRFAANQSLAIEEGTLEAVRSESSGIQLLSRERILLEIEKVRPGQFVTFLELFFSELPSRSLIPELSTTLTIGRVEALGPASHQRFPLASLAVGIVSHHGFAREAIPIVHGALHSWPARGSDAQLMNFAVQLLNASQFWQGDAPEIFWFYLVKRLRTLRDVTVQEWLRLVEMTALKEANALHPCLTLVQHSAFWRRETQCSLGDGAPGSPGLFDRLGLREWVESALTDVPLVYSQNDILRIVKDEGWPQSFASAWIGWQHALSLWKAWGLPVKERVNDAAPGLADVEERKDLHALITAILAAKGKAKLWGTGFRAIQS